jgi:hypothetical protein
MSLSFAGTEIGGLVGQGMALPHHGPDPTTGKLSDMGCHPAAGCYPPRASH